METAHNENIEQRIVAAARAMFIERGYADASMSDIAVAVGIKRSTLHYYFRTKDRLFQATFGDIVREILPRIQDILVKDTPFMERLNNVIDEYIALFTANPALPRFIIGEIQRDVQHLVRVLIDLDASVYIRNIKKRLIYEIRNGELRRIPLRTFFLTFYSQIVFPFLAENLVTTLMLNDREEFSDFLREWKRGVLLQMGYLLSSSNDRADIDRMVDEAIGRSGDAMHDA